MTWDCSAGVAVTAACGRSGWSSCGWRIRAVVVGCTCIIALDHHVRATTARAGVRRSAQPLHGRRLLCTQAQICMAFVSAATAIRSEERYRYHARTHVKPEGLRMRMREVARPSHYLPTESLVQCSSRQAAATEASGFRAFSPPAPGPVCVCVCCRHLSASVPRLCSHAPLCSD